MSERGGSIIDHKRKEVIKHILVFEASKDEVNDVCFLKLYQTN